MNFQPVRTNGTQLVLFCVPEQGEQSVKRSARGCEWVTEQARYKLVLSRKGDTREAWRDVSILVDSCHLELWVVYVCVLSVSCCSTAPFFESPAHSQLPSNKQLFSLGFGVCGLGVGVGSLGVGVWGLALGVWRLGVWVFGRLGVWAFGRLGVWAFGRLGVWAFGRLGVWSVG